MSQIIFTTISMSKLSKGFNISISNKFIAYAILALFAFFLFSLYIFEKQRASKNDAVILQLSSQMLLADKTFVDVIKYSELLVKNIVDNIGENPTNKKHIANVLHSFSKTYSEKVDNILSVTMFSWVDKDKRLKINSEFGLLKKFKDVSQRDYLEKTIAHPGRLFLGSPVTGLVSNQYIIPAGMGIVDKNGNYQGSIVFGLNIDGLYQKISNTGGDQGVFFALAYDGKIIKNTESFDKLSHEIDFSKNNIQIFQDLPLIGKKNITIYKKVDDFPYGIVLKINELKYSSEYRLSGYIELILTFLIFIFLLFLLKKDFINPILALSKISKSISAGKLDVAVPKSNIREINQLSQSILMVRDFVLEERESKMQLDVAKQVAEKANISKITLLRSITHDIKNYIFGIGGLAKLILDNKSSSQILHSEDLQAVETIGSQSEELMHFVEDLLDTNQVESGEFSLGVMDFCNVSDLINRMLLLNRGLAIKHQVMLAIDVEDNLPHLKCDMRRVKQVLTNLISNAIKYSKPESAVKIIAKYLQKENQIYFEIVDQGIGMTEDEIKMILAGRGKNIDKSAISYTIDSHGVGMPIVLRLVKLHRAKIKIESEKNVGTTVKLYFNIAEEETPRTKVGRRKIVKNKTILMVEDNPVNIKITSMILRNAGYKTSYVENGKEALKILDEKDFDLILMDGEMPVMNGYQATEALRDGSVFKKFKHYKTIPIIALMSSSDPETIKKSQKSGMNDHVEKSASKNKLLDMIMKYLG